MRDKRKPAYLQDYETNLTGIEGMTSPEQVQPEPVRPEPEPELRRSKREKKKTNYNIPYWGKTRTKKPKQNAVKLTGGLPMKTMGKITFLGEKIYRAPTSSEYNSTDCLDFYGASDQSTYSEISTQADHDSPILDPLAICWHGLRNDYMP